MKSNSIVPIELIESRIHVIRGQRIMLDQDLASIYGVPTGVLNQAVSRNIDRFPEDFAFRLNKTEWANLKSQSVISSWGGRRSFPYVFTEHGALMLANILRSDRAIQMSIEVIRAFINLRRASSTHEALAKEAKEVKSFLLKHAQKTDQEFRRVWNAIEKLSEPPPEQSKIGFRLN